MNWTILLPVVVGAALAAFGLAALRMGGVSAVAAALTGADRAPGTRSTEGSSEPPRAVISDLAEARVLAAQRAAEEGRGQAIVMARGGFRVVPKGDAGATPADTLDVVESGEARS
jgi:hypothetical protein